MFLIHLFSVLAKKGGDIVNNKLKGALAEANLTRMAFANMLGMNYTTLWHKIAGRTEFTESEIQKTCEVLNKDPKDLFFQKRAELKELEAQFNEARDEDIIDTIIEKLVIKEQEIKELLKEIRDVKEVDTRESG